MDADGGCGGNVDVEEAHLDEQEAIGFEHGPTDVAVPHVDPESTICPPPPGLEDIIDAVVAAAVAPPPLEMPPPPLPPLVHPIVPHAPETADSPFPESGDTVPHGNRPGRRVGSRTGPMARYYCGKGSIVFYMATKRIVAECDEHPDCSLSRTANPSPLPPGCGQGRCLAKMMAWLKHCHDGFSKTDHVFEYVPSLAERTVERQIIDSPDCHPSLKVLSEQERQIRPAENSEPEYVP